MTRPAAPARLYIRTGKRVTTFFYKHRDNTNEVLATAPTARKDKVKAAHELALRIWAERRGQPPKDASVAGLFARYFQWQQDLPESSSLKKAASTITGNTAEQKPLLAFFGRMLPAALRTPHIYQYIDARTMAGSPRGSSKEVALLSAVLSYGQRIGAVESNACHGVTLEKAAPRSRRVMWEEIELVTAQGRKQGGSAHIVALALRAAWLAFKRPSEVLAITTASITEAGLVFQDAKRRKSQGQRTTTIYWTPELRATVDEAVGLRRWAKFGGDRLIFGNMEGHAYSRSGWGTMLARLMQACAKEAAAAGQPFTPFALRDCRPGGITEKMQNQEQDVFEGTGHADRRMIDQVYDRRRARGAVAAR